MKKDKVKSVLANLLVVVVLMAIVVAVIWSLKTDATKDAKARQKSCEEIALIAGASEWREKGYNCLIIKDGKIIYDK